jgi:acyl-coenzyme A thioesterase PaaI-like protein
MEKAPERLRAHPPHTLADFKMTVPEGDAGEKRQLFADSVVSGSTNPMGLNASLWRDGDVAVLETVLGKAFEGAPDRAHGGVLAALIDESMGLVLAMERVLAYTVQLDISYRAPAPIGELVAARSWLDEKNGRKLSMRCEVRSVGVLVAEAQALFIAVDPGTFLAAN